MKSIKSIEIRLYDPEIKINLKKDTILKKIIASIVVILSGAILFTDKIATFNLTEIYGFADEQTLVWLVSQTLSPIILCIGVMLSPYKFSYFAPIYINFIQMYWIFNPEAYQLDDALLHVYAFGFCIVVFVFIIFVVKVLNLIHNENKVLIRNIKKLTRHIAITIKGKYIKEEDAKEYTIETVKIIDSMD
ncbi:hypothetical protein ACJRPK_10900 [Aquimarina sp. 2-A2]